MCDNLLLGLRYLPSSATFAPPNGDTKTTNENTKERQERVGAEFGILTARV